MRMNLSAEEARDILLDLPVSLEEETVPLDDALGRVLACDLTAEIPMPPFDRSPLDGYAVCGADTAKASRENPVSLTVTDEIPAGSAPHGAVLPGTAAKILTGAPMPEGADAVIRWEDTEREGNRVRIFTEVKPGQNCIFQGEEVQRGDCLVEGGTVLTPAEIGMMAAQGKTECTVWKRPGAALVTTGSELVETGGTLTAGKIYDSNQSMLAAMLEKNGMCCVSRAQVEDDLDRIAAAIERAWEETDLVITTGGASSGDYDFAVAAAERLSAEVLFWKVKMKPGSCVLAAVRGDKRLISLSGNPGSATVCLMRVVLPYLKKLQGRTDLCPEVVTLPLKEELRKKSPTERMLRGHMEILNGQVVFAENQKQGNGMIASLRGFELLGEVPAGSPPLPAGTMIRAYRF